MLVSARENMHEIGPDRNKIKIAHRLSVPIFCSSLIRNPDDKELKYFQLFSSRGVDSRFLEIAINLFIQVYVVNLSDFLYTLVLLTWLFHC